jgi:hypothetical protein
MHIVPLYIYDTENNIYCLQKLRLSGLIWTCSERSSVSCLPYVTVCDPGDQFSTDHD